jgi:hypothetical protein
MSKKKKVAIVVVVVVIGLFALAAIASTPYFNRDVNSIMGVTQFVVIKDGSLYKARFSLVDKDGVAAASDAVVGFLITDENGHTLYNKGFQISGSDFSQYKLLLTGAPIFAYAWQFDGSDVGTTTDVIKNNAM